MIDSCGTVHCTPSTCIKISYLQSEHNHPEISVGGYLESHIVPDFLFEELGQSHSLKRTERQWNSRFIECTDYCLNNNSIFKYRS